MVEWDNAFGGRAGKVRGRALVMTMVSTPAISAGACVRTVAAVVPWVFTVALEAIWVGREAFLSFAQQRLWWSAWLNHSSLL